MTLPSRPGIDAFHRERSKCVDAFAELEEAIISLLQAANLKFGGESFGLKLGKLAKAKPTPRISAAAVEKLPDLLKRCEAISELRNDIVHSRLKIATIGEDQKACFINLNQLAGSGEIARLFTLTALRAVSGDMQGLANELRALRC